MELIEAEQLALSLMDAHCLYNWTFQFSKAVCRFGCCKVSQKIIEISAPLTKLNDRARVKNTILHEIAHALTPDNGHDHVWRRVALSVGCDGERCYDSTAVIRPAARFQGACACRTINRHRRKNIYCTRCKKSFTWSIAIDA